MAEPGFKPETVCQQSPIAKHRDPRKTENIHVHKNLYKNIHSSIIHNSQNVQTTGESI